MAAQFGDWRSAVRCSLADYRATPPAAPAATRRSVLPVPVGSGKTPAVPGRSPASATHECAEPEIPQAHTAGARGHRFPGLDSKRKDSWFVRLKRVPRFFLFRLLARVRKAMFRWAKANVRFIEKRTRANLIVSQWSAANIGNLLDLPLRNAQHSSVTSLSLQSKTKNVRAKCMVRPAGNLYIRIFTYQTAVPNRTQNESR
jgi:hypothetical protein